MILKVLAKEDSVIELAQQYDVSRKTIYQWLSRYESKGLSGLVDESRQPKRSPMKTSAELALEIVQLRKDHPRWGPKKIVAIMARRHPGMNVPAAAGEPSDAVEDDLVQRYGEEVRAMPRAWDPRFPLGVGLGGSCSSERWSCCAMLPGGIRRLRCSQQTSRRRTIWSTRSGILFASAPTGGGHLHCRKGSLSLSLYTGDAMRQR